LPANSGREFTARSERGFLPLLTAAWHFATRTEILKFTVAYGAIRALGASRPGLPATPLTLSRHAQREIVAVQIDR
jgi:hypothetical protein